MDESSPREVAQRRTPSLAGPRPFPDPALYPFAQRWFEVGERRMHYVDEGRGRPILFVHGTPSWSFEWRHLISALCTRYRCIAPDHLGFGLSDKPSDGAYEPEDHARRLAELVAFLDLRDLVLVVHDFGGPIGLPLALSRESRVSSLVVLNTWMWPNGDDRTAVRVSRFVSSWLGRFLYLRLNASPRWLLPAVFADRKCLPRAVHRHYLAPFPSARERRAPWILGRALTGADPYYRKLWEARAPLSRLPMSLVWGTRDPALGPLALDRWRRNFPHARIFALPTGHFPQEEMPAAVADAIATSLENTAVPVEVMS